MFCIIILQLIDPLGFVCADIKAVFILRNTDKKYWGVWLNRNIRKLFIYLFIHSSDPG